MNALLARARRLLEDRRRTKTLAAAAAALLVAAAVKSKVGGGKPAPEDSTAAVERGPLELRFRETGEIAAKDSVDVASKVSGRILTLAVQEGDRVAAGQKLAVIQPGRTETERYQPSTVTAPIGGVVMRYVKGAGSNAQDTRFAKVGDYVTGLFESNNPNYLMTIGDLSSIVVELKISEMDILKLSEKMPVTVKVDALPDSVFPAVVRLISPQAEKDANGLKVFRVQVALDKTDPRLRPGMTARVDALLDRRENALKIPLPALFEEGGERFVYLHSRIGSARRAKVEVGLRNELDVEVLAGVKEGDRVLTDKPAGELSKPGGQNSRRMARAARRAMPGR